MTRAVQPEDEGLSRRMRRAFDDAPIGMAVCTPTGRVVQVNAALEELLGRTAADLAGGALFDVTHPDDVDGALASCARLREGGERVTRHELRFLHAAGGVVTVLVSAALLDGDTGDDQVVLHVEDISVRKALEAQLTHQALHDPLTGVANRALFLDRLDHALAHAEREGECLTVLFVDVDHFKAVNDSHGHAVGDQVLVAFARHLEALTRPGDTVARLGGDEFAVLCPRTGPGEAPLLAQRIRDTVAPADLPTTVTAPGASVGTAVARPGDRPDEVLHRADSDMYATRQGRRTAG